MKQFTLEDIKPCKKYILVNPLERPKETDVGFVMPEEGYTPTPVVGQVVAVGEESQFKVGQMVFFRRYSVDSLKFYGNNGKLTEVSMISDDEIIGFVKQND